MEWWLLPFFWATVDSASLDTASTAPFRWSPVPPAPHIDPAGSTDYEVVRVLYAILAGRVHCARCGAPLGPSIEVRRSRGPFARTRIVAATSCRGPARHPHRALVVIERNGDLRLSPLLPTSRR